MKQTIRPTILSITVCIGICTALFVLMHYYGEPWILIPIFIVLLAIGMFYRLLSVTVDENDLSINRLLRTTKIPMSQISSVKRFPHSNGKFGLFGSGGFWGNSGWFQVPGEGKCFAYLCDPKDCIIVTKKNGKKYLLACDNPVQMVEYIQNRIK